MSLSPSPVEQVNDVVIIHWCRSLIGLKSPTCKWSFNTEVKDVDSSPPSTGKCMRLQREDTDTVLFMPYCGICFA